MQLLTPSNKKCACELRLWLISSVSPLVQIICCPLNEIMLWWLHISENATNDQPSADIEDFIKTRSKDLYLIVVLLRTCQKIYAHLPHSFSRVSDVYIAYGFRALHMNPFAYLCFCPITCWYWSKLFYIILSLKQFILSNWYLSF